MKPILLSLLMLMMLSGCAESTLSEKQKEPLQISVAGGDVIGFHESGIDKWLGIPFAAPPVGELRWKAPQPVQPWDSVRQAKEFGYSPMQHNIWGDMMYRSPGFSEDCLYLNVWAPEGEREGLPVLLYYYGGGLMAGDGSETRYDGASMAREGMIVVTSNYRLNVFGFMAHPELSEESPHKASGNYGHLDQVAALQWVKNNIRAFGGDPSKITIGGESAGSMSTSALLASPLSRDLIAGAIGQSGAFFPPLNFPVELAEGEKRGEAFAKTVGATSLAALRGIPADSLYAQHLRSKLYHHSIVDGYFRTQSLEDSYQAGSIPKIPLLVGWNSAEQPAESFLGEKRDLASLQSAVSERVPQHHQELLALYALDTEEEVYAASQEIATDLWMGFATWKWAHLHAQTTSSPVFTYFYDQPRPGTTGGAPHAEEIPYALGNLDVHKLHEYSEADHQTSQTMKNYFATFVKTGNPHDGTNLPWPQISASSNTRPTMHLKPESELIEVNDARYLIYEKEFGARANE